MERFFCDWKIKYDVFHSFGSLASFQNVILLRCRLRTTQKHISVEIALRFVTMLMVPKHKRSPISRLLSTYSNLKISLPLATIIPPNSAISTLCLTHNYSIIPPTIW